MTSLMFRAPSRQGLDDGRSAVARDQIRNALVDGVAVPNSCRHVLGSVNTNREGIRPGIHVAMNGDETARRSRDANATDERASCGDVRLAACIHEETDARSFHGARSTVHSELPITGDVNADDAADDVDNVVERRSSAIDDGETITRGPAASCPGESGRSRAVERSVVGQLCADLPGTRDGAPVDRRLRVVGHLEGRTRRARERSAETDVEL